MHFITLAVGSLNVEVDKIASLNAQQYGDCYSHWGLLLGRHSIQTASSVSNHSEQWMNVSQCAVCISDGRFTRKESY